MVIVLCINRNPSLSRNEKKKKKSFNVSLQNYPPHNFHEYWFWAKWKKKPLFFCPCFIVLENQLRWRNWPASVQSFSIVYYAYAKGFVVVMIWIIVLSFTGKYCGRTMPEPIKASAQSLYIMFHSDELGTLKGFKAEWSSNKIGVKSGAKGKLYMID